MKMLITGGTGFVGSELVKKIQNNNGNQILLVLRKKPNYPVKKNVDFVLLSDPNWKSVVYQFEAEIIIHLASYLTSKDDDSEIEQLINSNIYFGSELLNSIATKKLKLFINTGSFSEYDENAMLNPAYFYSATKTAFRSILKYFQNKGKFKIINIIPYTIYGKVEDKKKLIDHIYESTNGLKFVEMSPGNQVLDFIHIDDIINFFEIVLFNIVKISEMEMKWIDVHLGTGKGTTPRQIENIFIKLGLKTKIVWGALPYRFNDTLFAVAPNSFFLKFIDWSPRIDVEKGIKLYINEKKQNGI